MAPALGNAPAVSAGLGRKPHSAAGPSSQGCRRAASPLNGKSIPVIDIVDQNAGALPGFGQTDLETRATGPALAAWGLPADEWQALAFNYTSGTSGRPKAVIYPHRGACLMAVGTVCAWQ